MAGISSKASGKMENKFKFNDGTELERKEFSDGSGLEMYNTTYRGYDPQIGRFWQIDPLAEISHNYTPFAYANNNPIFLNDPTGLISDSLHPKELPEVIVNAKAPKRLDSENGQVFPARSWYLSLFLSPRKWLGHVPTQGSNGLYWRPVYYEVNNKGYLTGLETPNIFTFDAPVGFTPVNLKAIFRLKNFIKGEYSIYRGFKNGLPYFGKARGGINFRYSAEQIAKMEVEVIAGLEKIPSNAVALGVEQLVIDLNGGVGSGKLANINNATIKEIYINEARFWLDANLPNWEQLLKFK